MFRVRGFGQRVGRILPIVFGLTLAFGSSSWSSFAQEGQADGASEHSESEGQEKREEPKKPRSYPTVRLGQDPRGEPDVTLCSQNLKLFGTVSTIKANNPKYTAGEHAEKVSALTTRFVKAKCDVIALQEVMGLKEENAKAALQQLVDELRRRTNRVFSIRVTPPAEGGMTMGFLIADDRASILSAFAYEKVELPTIGEKDKPRLFLRTPMELQLSVNSRETGDSKVVSVINFHFKSKRGGAKDPTGLEWETYRMEMAEALRRVIDLRHKQSFASSESILAVMGDRNANFDVASARILEGTLNLSRFRSDGGCRLSKRGLPLCKVDVALPRRLFSVFENNKAVHSLPGTFNYQGEYSWLDDIMMPAESLPYAWRSAFTEGEYDSGVVYEPKNASDHALVYVKLNW